MAKKQIQLTESDIRNIVAETVQRLIEEGRTDRYENAYQLSSNASQDRINAYNNRQGDPHAWARREQRFRNGATKAFNDEYGYNVTADWDGNIKPNDPSKPVYCGGHYYERNGDTFATGRAKQIPDGSDDYEYYSGQMIGCTSPWYSNRSGAHKGNYGENYPVSPEGGMHSNTHIPSKMAQMKGDAAVRRLFRKK